MEKRASATLRRSGVAILGRRVGDDGLTDRERIAIGNSYRAHEARQPSQADLDALSAFLNSSSDAHLV